jgi:O-antigen ligase
MRGNSPTWTDEVVETGEEEDSAAAWERTRAKPLPVVLALVVVSNFLPAELSFFIFGLRLTATRLLLILLTPYLLMLLGRKISSGHYRFVLSDLAVLLAGLWMLIASSVTSGIQGGLTHSGPEVLEFVIGYLASRVLLAAPGQVLSLMNLLCSILAVVGLTALLDPLTSTYFIHDLAKSISGYGLPLQMDYRKGILRASGMMEHPILLGAVCMIGLLSAWALPVRRKLFALCGCTIGLLASVSSGPTLAAIIGFGLLAYDRMFRERPWRWRVLLALVAVFLGLSFVLLGTPLGLINRYLVFDPSSGYSREFEWQTVGLYVSSSPWVGIGFGWAVIAKDIGAFASIDSVWLGKALIYGIPCSVFIALTFIGSTLTPLSAPGANLTSIETRIGILLSIVMWLILLLGFTVYFWGTFWILTTMLAGVRAHLGELGKLQDV